MALLTVDPYVDDPLRLARLLPRARFRLRPAHALEPGRAAVLGARVRGVLAACRGPQVRPLVVQPVVILVVCPWPAGQELVHGEVGPAIDATLDAGVRVRPAVARLAARIPLRVALPDVPPVLHHQVAILVIDERDPSGGFCPVQRYDLHVSLDPGWPCPRLAASRRGGAYI